jgi:hypothetical protein
MRVPVWLACVVGSGVPFGLGAMVCKILTNKFAVRFELDSIGLGSENLLPQA